MKLLDVFDKASEKALNMLSPILQRRRLTQDEYLCELRNERHHKHNIHIKPSLIISVDDLCSLGRNAGEADMGGRQSDEVFTALSFLHDKGLKLALYLIPYPAFKSNPELLSSHSKVASPFIPDHLLELSNSSRVQILQHGFRHMRLGVRGRNRSMEYEWQSSYDIDRNICSGYIHLLTQGIVAKGFKPPAWSVGQLDGSYEMLKSRRLYDFDTVSLSSPANGLNYSNHAVSHIYPQYLFEPATTRSVVNLPQNLSLLWDLEYSKKVIKLISERRGLLSLQTHASVDSKIISDGLCHVDMEKLLRLADYANKCGYNPILPQEII